ncbi:hypothetical protein JTE90_028406 [Oedothorax gibbosus]|uniref:Uncharacterized protein n=1 Tax=Oedothorax gibbosus TaxID=931172 RepID=A0AAV6VEM6_9ARAC|nr:hypothetical protein JTE90_028406 [Oedothorax gibbosus]
MCSCFGNFEGSSMEDYQLSLKYKGVSSGRGYGGLMLDAVCTVSGDNRSCDRKGTSSGLRLPKGIEPCTCREIREYDYVIMECRKIDDTGVLLSVFENARRYCFNNFTLSESTLPYIPHAIFDDVEHVKDLKLEFAEERKRQEKKKTSEKGSREAAVVARYQAAYSIQCSENVDLVVDEELDASSVLEGIEPCTCREIREYDYVIMECRKIDDTGVLLSVFENARRYCFNNFTLSESTLPYIPHAIFDDVEVKIMIMDQITLNNMFDELPSNPGLENFVAYRVKVREGWDWKKLASFTNLESLAIVDMPLKVLSVDFRRNVSKKLKHLTLNECRFQKLQDDEFADFTDLEHIHMSNNAIVEIKRTMFPRRAKLISLVLMYNKITYIPNNLFSDMPDLEYVSFSGNLISTLPDATFQPVLRHLEYLDVSDNPIKCDCRLVWVLQYRGLNLVGKCYAPKALHDKDFYELTRKDIPC